MLQAGAYRWLGPDWIGPARRRLVRGRAFAGRVAAQSGFVAGRFRTTWREILKRRVPYFGSLPADLQLQLKRHIQVFLAEKPFIACDGLEVTDEMRSDHRGAGVPADPESANRILLRTCGRFSSIRARSSSVGCIRMARACCRIGGRCCRVNRGRRGR